MTLKILGSSSAGNCYILENSSETLIIECGVRLSEIKKALNFNISKVVACLASHQHGDHSKSIGEVMNAGITVLALPEVFIHHGIPVTHFNAKVIEPGKGYKVGNFRILPFSVYHDVPCVGFLISHPESGNLVFVTDTFMVEHTFDGLNTIILEANYMDSILEENIISGLVHPSMKGRLLQSHMEISTTKEILLANDLSAVNNIILCHLSSGNSNAKLFMDEITSATGKCVYVAKKGLELDLNITPY